MRAETVTTECSTTPLSHIGSLSNKQLKSLYWKMVRYRISLPGDNKEKEFGINTCNINEMNEPL